MHRYKLLLGLLLVVAAVMLWAASSDPYQSHTTEVSAPAAHAYAITPNDSTDLTVFCRSVYVGSAGDLKVDMVGGETVTFANVDPGMFPVRVKRVYATGTTAADLACVY